MYISFIKWWSSTLQIKQGREVCNRFTRQGGPEQNANSRIITKFCLYGLLKLRATHPDHLLLFETNRRRNKILVRNRHGIFLFVIRCKLNDQHRPTVCRSPCTLTAPIGATRMVAITFRFRDLVALFGVVQGFRVITRWRRWGFGWTASAVPIW